MDEQSCDTSRKDFYLHLSTTAGAFNMSDTVLEDNFEKEYIDLISYSERNYTGEVRKITPLPYPPEFDDLIEQINSQLATPDYGNGITSRVSWIHGTKDLPTPEQIKRAGGHLIVKCYLCPDSFNRARERSMRSRTYTEMRVQQIFDLMKTMGQEKVWWFIGDEPFSGYHWINLSDREPFSSRSEALESYRKYIFGGQSWNSFYEKYLLKDEYRSELEEAGIRI